MAKKDFFVITREALIAALELTEKGYHVTGFSQEANGTITPIIQEKTVGQMQTALTIMANSRAREIVKQINDGTLYHVHLVVVDEHLFVYVHPVKWYMVFSPNSRIGMSADTNLGNVEWRLDLNMLESVSRIFELVFT